MDSIKTGGETSVERRGAFSALDLLNLYYIAFLSALILICAPRIEGWATWFAIHAGLGLGLFAFLKLTARRTNAIVVFARAWYTPFLFVFHYQFTYALNQAAIPLYAPGLERLLGLDLLADHLSRRYYLDAFLVVADDWMFGYQPAVWFSKSLNSPLFGELMYMFYFSFYLFIPVGGMVLWLQRRREAFEDFLFRSAFTMWLCCLFFILFPTAGPKFYFGVKQTGGLYHGFAFAGVMEYILDSFEMPTGGFPSSHVAVSAAATIAAFIYDKRLFAVLLVPFLAICFATVFTCEHYAIDIFGALVFIPLLYWGAGPVKRRLARLAEREPAELGQTTTPAPGQELGA